MSNERPLLPSVRQWLDWELTNVLPLAGGTLDQDPVFMRDLRTILSLKAGQKQQKQGVADIRKKIEEEISSGRAKRKV